LDGVCGLVGLVYCCGEGCGVDEFCCELGDVGG